MISRVESSLRALSTAEQKQRELGKTLKKAGTLAVVVGVGIGAVDMLVHRSPAKAVLRASGFIASAAGLGVVGEGFEQRADNAGIHQEKILDLIHGISSKRAQVK